MTRTETEKRKPEAKEPRQDADELRMAAELHALNLVILEHLARTHPWATTLPAAGAFTIPEAWPPSAGFSPEHGWGRVHPFTF